MHDLVNCGADIFDDIGVFGEVNNDSACVGCCIFPPWT